MPPRKRKAEAAPASKRKKTAPGQSAARADAEAGGLSDAMDDPQEVSLSTSSSIFEYLERLPSSAVRSIYALPSPRGPTVAAAVVRSSCLTDMARQFALRLVTCGGSFGVRGMVEGWVNRHGRGDALMALRGMEAMGIIEPTLGLAARPGEADGEDADDAARGEAMLAKDAVLTPEFNGAMKLYLITSSSSPWPTVTDEQIALYKKTGEQEDGKPSRDPPSRRELEAHTQSQWDSVLHFLVGSEDNDGNGANGIEEPNVAMVNFLTRIGLMQEDPDYTGKDRSHAPLVITSKGYEFMLRDTNAQVWQFVLQYLNSMAHHDLKDTIRKEALSFLICLGSCRIGEGYFSSVLGSKSARVLMKDFARFGLLFVCRVAGKTAFYPTRVAVNLVASNEKGGSRRSDALLPGVAATRSLEEAMNAPDPTRSHLAVIVQTNFQVVAYTRSKLHISTLGLFCDVQSYKRLPNVVFFHLTRDSIKSAFRLGVTADQILRFLQVHAHPMMRSGNQPMPPANVRDQILLWDRERRRVVMDEVWVHQCRDDAEFSAVGLYASDSEALAWGNAHTNKLYVHLNKSEAIQSFIRKWRTRPTK